MCLLAVFVAALAGRFFFVWTAPYASGDWVLYANVAHNILNGCGVAVTLPGGTACVPHFGGNQLPLFPAFVAVLWRVFGVSDLAVRLAQSVVASFACTWLAFAVLRVTGSRRAALAAGLVQALSLVQAYWAGSLLTETLALAGTQWVLAELLLSFGPRAAAARLRVIPLGVALAAASWARMDGILLIAPIALAAVMIGGARRGLALLCCVVLIGGAPSALWAVRNIAVGIDPLPISSTLPDGTAGPAGYIAWVNSWTATAQQHADTLYLGGHEYRHIRIDPTAYRDNAEREAAESLLARLRPQSGKIFPADIDAGFAALAARHQAAMSTMDIIARDAQRVWSLTARWIWPWTHTAGDGRDHLTPSDLYRFPIFWGFVLSFVAGCLRRERILIALGALTLVFCVVRVAFFAAIAGIEVRYMAELAPFIEASAALGVAKCLRRAEASAGGISRGHRLGAAASYAVDMLGT
jgi:hypothetical protein